MDKGGGFVMSISGCTSSTAPMLFIPLVVNQAVDSIILDINANGGAVEGCCFLHVHTMSTNWQPPPKGGSV